MNLLADVGFADVAAAIFILEHAVVLWFLAVRACSADDGVELGRK